MKCNIPKPTSMRDKERLYNELCKIRCSKCGAVIKKYENPIFMIYEQGKIKNLCKKCKEATDEKAD